MAQSLSDVALYGPLLGATVKRTFLHFPEEGDESHEHSFDTAARLQDEFLLRKATSLTEVPRACLA